LLKTTHLHLVARLGEGFFPGVYRGTAVIIATKGAQTPDAMVRCFRLSPPDRRRVLSGQARLEDLAGRLGHLVPQARFASDGEGRFDIDLRDDETAVIESMEQVPHDWTKWVMMGRGVELSKHGRVVRCTACGVTAPAPRARQKTYTCRDCGEQVSWDEVRAMEIVRSRTHNRDESTAEKTPGEWVHLLAGEDVDRYRCAPSREIRLGVPGIDYKDPAFFARRKLLVRKTGVGLKAAIDDSGAYTVQVVFHLLPAHAGAPPFLLEYLQGVLCSRIMLAYHLARGGECEWRSHPYVTPRVLATLPIPDIRDGSWRWKQARAIASAVARRPVGATPNDPADLHIERLVAGLYELSDGDCEWALRVLNRAQGLEPIAPLRLPSSHAIRPLRID
jgi:DNA-directed RNA polymerase subunit RPC12/RpoP